MKLKKPFLIVICFLIVFAMPACGSSESPGNELPVYQLTEQAFTGLQAIWEPNVPSSATQESIDTGQLKITEHAALLEAGLGVSQSAGRDWIENLELAPGFSSGSPANRRSLLYIWQAADPQIIDEESPIRFEAYADLYRPHGHLTTQVFESHVRSARRISELSGRPFDFALLAGDLTDGSQRNELTWMLDVLNGADIDPDSGRDDDPVLGPGNDYNDPFRSDGLGVPWYAAIGNHETLYNGGFGTITDELRQAAVGKEIFEYDLFPNGFCDGSTPDAEVVTQGKTAADENRVPQRRQEVLSMLFEAAGQPAGHGLSSSDVSAGRGYYSAQPIEGKPIRLITLDTVNSNPQGIGEGARGSLKAEQLQWLQTELASADAANELIVVMSHHIPADFAPASPVSGDELVEVLAGSQGVILHVAGHGHENEASPFTPLANGEHGYWELMLASTVDFPMHSRILEIVDEGNGFISVYATNIDHNAPEDSLAHHGRQLAGAKLAFGTVTSQGDVAAFWEDDLQFQNMLLRIAIPQALQTNLASYSWPTRIESEETLQNLSGP
ncbi:MAG: metallophosphoesterase [Deltaproteobacteria bacterium]|nr:metallophosphoesterase [Deltaproteobacteria bacterium]